MKVASIVCFAGGDWWYHHPHSYNHLMKEFSKDMKVLYVNSLPVGKISLSGAGGKQKIVNKVKSILRSFRKVQNNLYVFTPLFIPVKDNRIVINLNTIILNFQIRIITKVLNFRSPLVWITNPNGYIYARGMKGYPIVYQIVDKVSAYRHSGKIIEEFDEKLSETADFIFTPGRKLYEEKMKKYPNKVYRIKHGVDTEHFSKITGEIPDNFPKSKKPVFTYWGSVDYKKVDYNLLKFIEVNATEYEFLFIGRVFDFPISDFSKSGNIHFAGEKSYMQLSSYASFSSGFLIPWDQNDEMNKHASPIKVREYFATGKPVITTYIPEFDEFSGMIYVSKDYPQFVENIKKALNEKDDESVVNRRKEFVQKSSWRNVYEEIFNIISAHIS